jgi:lipoprotein-anchoring transpeptidase ErfK/SrfK
MAPRIVRAFAWLAAVGIMAGAPGLLLARGRATITVWPELALQIRLARAGFSPGEIDGHRGANTDRVLAMFRATRHLSASATEQSLEAAAGGRNAELLTVYTVSADDLAGPFLPEIPADLMAQADLPGLYYTSALEGIAEKVHSSPELIVRLNPGVPIQEGQELQVPNVAREASTSAKAAKATKIVVSKHKSVLSVIDNSGRVIFAAPVTSGSVHDPLPIGTWKVTGVAHNPVFNYNPALFWDADPSHAKARIPAGPNNPVGVVWIDLSKPHYGIHGTASPNLIGHVTSHGCVRLTNWDATTVASFATTGMPVVFEE